ncbi:MAG TPA: ABC transporter substrate-binding protein [Oleiagrimonas sp.]|nr:ABC transporter substrate-binding protein [Oleiagrimonas sp.]
MNRLVRPLLLACILMAGIVMHAGVIAAPIKIVDVRGRTITLSQPTHKLAIDDGRFLVALSLLLPDPVKVLAAWPHDINRLGKRTYALYVKKFPAIKQVPRVASSAGNFNMEALLAADPDVAVFSLGHGPTSAQTAMLKSVGIQTVFIDFARHPFKNQDHSLRILGKLTGSLDQAKRFIAFRKQRMDAIRQKVATLAPSQRPGVFLEAHAGISNDCCYSPGKGNVGAYIDFVGGHNIGAEVIPGASGKLSMEYILSRNPKVYIATGGPQLAKTGGLVLGRGFSKQQARASLKRITERHGIAHMGAVRRGDVHGLAHQLLKSPLDIVAIEVLAKWIHPQLFAGLDPAETLATINREFLAVPYTGTFWVSLKR